MKFSILVPVYNVEKYLEQCVESLLNQTYNGEYEIILVDDGSTDSSGVICDKYAKDHPEKVKVIHKENGGHTSARLAAIKAATGEYCLFSDSDDFVENNLLKTVDSVLIENPNTDMIIYSFSYFENGKKISRKNYPLDKYKVYEDKSKKKLYELLISSPVINSLWTKVIKTDILKNDPTDYNKIANMDIAEDAYIVSFFLTASQKIVSIPDVLYNYRIISGSISRSYNPHNIERKNTICVYNRFKEYLPEWGIDNEECHQRLNARWINEVMYTFTSYYENTPLSKKKAILNYNWDSMIPVDAHTDTNNPYENKTYRKLYTWLTNKKFLNIKLFFIHKNLYKKIRRLKSRLLRK